MNREERTIVCFGGILEKRRDKLAVLKKAITKGAYKVKAGDIADKILKERLFVLGLTLYHKYPKCGNNQSPAWPGNAANNPPLKSGAKEERCRRSNLFGDFRVEPLDANGLKIMTKENLSDRHIHLHSYAIISCRWPRHRSKIHTKIFPRFACGLFLGISIIGVLRLQWWS